MPFSLDKIGTRRIFIGVLNVTLASFSNGERFFAADAALSHAMRMGE